MYGEDPRMVVDRRETGSYGGVRSPTSSGRLAALGMGTDEAASPSPGRRGWKAKVMVGPGGLAGRKSSRAVGRAW